MCPHSVVPNINNIGVSESNSSNNIHIVYCCDNKRKVIFCTLLGYAAEKTKKKFVIIFVYIVKAILKKYRKEIIINKM